MSAVLKLESFDGQIGVQSVQKQDAPGTYEDGVRDGQIAAMQAMETEQLRLKESVAEALVDGMFGYQEAQTHFATSMTHFVTAMLDQFIPPLLAPALHLQLRELLVQALEKETSQPVVVRLPPDQIDAFKAIIDDLDLSRIAVESDATLGDHAAFVVGDDTETSIDFDALVAAIADHTAVLTTPVKEVS